MSAGGQMDWVGESPPHVTGSASSEAAARALARDPQRLSRLQGRVLGALHRAGSAGLTDEELQRRLRMDPSTERPRRVELVRKGWVFDSGHTRWTRSGRAAVIWVAKAWRIAADG